MLRGLFAVVFLAALGWSGYWWLGSSAKDTALRAWIADRQAAGWVADYQDLIVQGYPSRFDTRITDLELADPDANWAWFTPELQILALSYKPNHIIAVWPHTQSVSTPQERIDVESSDMRASVQFAANTDLELQHTVLIVKDLKLTSTADWTSTLNKATFTTDPAPGEENAYDVGFQAEQFKPAHVFKAIIDPSDLLPDVFEIFRIRATTVFDAPWDRHAVEGNKPHLTRLDISDFSATWGELNFQAKGSVELDAQGYPTGKISVRAKNWQNMVQLAVNSGALSQNMADVAKSVLGLVAALSGNPDTIDAPLSFSNRTMKLGPIPIGPAPRFPFH